MSILSKAIVSLGLAGRLSAETVAKGAYRRFYPHSVGHWLGLDTHDTPGCGFDVSPRTYHLDRARCDTAVPRGTWRWLRVWWREVQAAFPSVVHTPQSKSFSPLRIPLSSPLVEGVVLTIEPGLYIPLDAEDVPAGAPTSVAAAPALRARKYLLARPLCHGGGLTSTVLTLAPPCFVSSRLACDRRVPGARRADRGRRPVDQGQGGCAQCSGASRGWGD